MELPKPYFKKIVDVGGLDIEYVFFEANYPILFSCTDIMNNLYLCVCYDNRKEQSWIISKTTSKMIIDMLSDKITLYDSLKSPYNKNYIIRWSYKYKKEDVFEVEFININELDLPTKGEYLDAEIGEFDEYIKKLKLRQ